MADSESIESGGATDSLVETGGDLGEEKQPHSQSPSSQKKAKLGHPHSHSPQWTVSHTQEGTSVSLVKAMGSNSSTSHHSDDEDEFSIPPAASVPPPQVAAGHVPPAAAAAVLGSSSSEHSKRSFAESSAEANVGEISVDDWSCEKCTFINPGTDLCCGMCYVPRIQIKDLNVQWQWQAEEKWIAYDLATVIDLERGYQDKQKSVELRHGFFSDFPGQYMVSVMKGGKMYQTNTASGTNRNVRRIGADDGSIFVVVPPDEVEDRLNICVVCQYKFDLKEDSEEPPCKLPKCVNHYFHRKCVAQWVQLHGTCPTCKKGLN